MYNLHLLGWYSFQQLCLTVIREILGQTVESFLDTNDAGQDGAFSGTWKLHGEEDLTGKFVFQCKFTNAVEKKLSLSDVKDELSKAKRLVEHHEITIYILLTNAGVSGASQLAMEKEFKKVGMKHFKVFSETWLIQQIKENKRLRMLAPRVYGLGDLTEIIDERAYAQASALLNTLKEEFAKIVITSAYHKAIDAINEHGFVLLVGEPAAGKTTIASLLAMAALDQWGSNTIKVEDSQKLVDRWNPDHSSQFFWIDDAFGVTQYESSLTITWNHVVPQIRAMLKKGVKIVMTSRDYIYARARNDLKESSFPLFKESQVVIDVHDLTMEEKRQILYNHLKLGSQPKDFLLNIKPYLENIANNNRFIPETARRISDPIFTKNLYLTEYHLKEFVEKQESFLIEVLEKLDNDSKAGLGLIYMRNGFLESPVELEEIEERAVNRMSSTLGGSITALEAMNHSLVQIVQENDENTWKFKHPTIGDAYSKMLVGNSELINIYLKGTSIDKLIDQVTCGNVDIQNAFIVPKKLFPLMISRLNEYSTSKNYKSAHLSEWRAEYDLHRFLSYRCSSAFLSTYLDCNPEILEKICNPSLYLDSKLEITFALKLFREGMLPEENRKSLVKKVCEYAVEGYDFFLFEKEEFRNLLSKKEQADLWIKLENEFIPNADNIRGKWETEYDGASDPADYIEPFIATLNFVTNHFSNNEPLTKSLNYQSERVEVWIAHSEPASERSSRDKLEYSESTKQFTGSRSIFDDIDL